MSKIFSEPAPGIVKDDTVVVSEAFQEAFFKADEEGATAGAFTGKRTILLMVQLTLVLMRKRIYSQITETNVFQYFTNS